MSGEPGAIKLRRLTGAELSAEMRARPVAGGEAAVAVSTSIIERVRKEGDAALREFALRFDGAALGSIRVDPYFTEAMRRTAPPALVEALESSAKRIRRFAQAQLAQFRDLELEIEAGVVLGQRVEAIGSVGAYVPGGRYPLISSALMCVIPAKVAGVERVAVMTPPGKDGLPHPLIALAASIAGADELYVSGGAQGIAALAYGTESVKAVDKVVGPGNAYVSAAKRLIASEVGIDFYAGPSEVFIVADDSADPALLAADMAAQAEHDPEARSVLICFSENLAAETERRLELLAAELSTGAIIRASIAAKGAAILAKDLEEASAIARDCAPEHLELHIRDASRESLRFRNYGSLFIGQGAGEVLGDYSSGLNHTLPTNRGARYASGLSVKDFLCLRTTLSAGKGEGAAALARDAALIGAAEGLMAHERAAILRAKA